MTFGCRHLYRTLSLHPYVIKSCCSNAKGIIFGKKPTCINYKNLLHKSSMFLKSFKGGSVPKSCKGCCELVFDFDWSSVEDIKFENFYISNWFDCNANCIYCVNNCITDKKITDEIHKSPCYDALPILEYLKNENLLGDKLKIFITGGEPSLLKEMPDVIDFFKNNNAVFFSVFSSGIAYCESFHDLLKSDFRTELIISPDCGNPDLYKKIKNVDRFYDVFNNIKKYGEGCSENNRIIVKYIFVKNFNDNEKSVLEFFDRIDEYASGSQYAVRFDVDYNYKDVEHSRVSDLLKFANEEIEHRKKAQTFSPITSQLSQNL